MNERTGTISPIDPDIDQMPEIEFERYELREGPAYRFELDRRDFLKALGGGILVLYLLDRDAPEAEAQPPGGRRRGGGGGGPCPRTSAPGCTSARTARSRSTPARPRSARTSGPR